MAVNEFAQSDIAARSLGTDATLASSPRVILTAALQELIEVEITATIGAEHGERTPERGTQRNGRRSKLISTPAGDVEVGIPKLRQGSFFPAASKALDGNAAVCTPCAICLPPTIGTAE
jgi:putative transposase